MKRFLLVLAVLAVAVSALPAAAAPEMVLRLGETHVADYPTTKGDMEFARLVRNAPAAGSRSRSTTASSSARKRPSSSRCSSEPWTSPG